MFARIQILSLKIYFPVSVLHTASALHTNQQDTRDRAYV